MATVAWRSWFSNPKPVVEIVQIIAALVVLAVYGNALSWRLIALTMLVAFFSQIRFLLEGLTSFVSPGASIEIYLAGQTIKLSSAEASDFLQKIADDIKMMINELTEDQQQLFLFIIKDPSAQGEIGEPPLRFERKKPPTVLQEDLRALRERHLLMPSGGGTWREHKSPELTPFGKLVVKTQSFEGKRCDPQRMETYLDRARSQIPDPTSATLKTST